MATINLDRFRDVDLVIDKANDNFIQKQWVSTGDREGRTLTVMVTDGGVVGEIAGVTASLLWTNQSNGLTDEHAFVLKDKATSTFVIEYPTHMLTPGTVIAQIRVWYNGKTITTKPFEIAVSGIAGQMKGIVAQQEFGFLTTVLADANKFNSEIAKKVSHGENESITKPMLSKALLEEISNENINVNVNTSMIEDGAVKDDKIPNKGIKQGKLDRQTVGKEQLQNTSVNGLQTSFVKVDGFEIYDDKLNEPGGIDITTGQDSNGLDPNIYMRTGYLDVRGVEYLEVIDFGKTLADFYLFFYKNIGTADKVDYTRIDTITADSKSKVFKLNKQYSYIRMLVKGTLYNVINTLSIKAYSSDYTDKDRISNDIFLKNVQLDTTLLKNTDIDLQTNLYNPQKSTRGGLLYNGKVANDNDYSRSEFIPLNYGEKASGQQFVTYFKHASSASPDYMFLSTGTLEDADDFLPISSIVHSYDASSKTITFTVPEGSNYRFFRFVDANPTVTASDMLNTYVYRVFAKDDVIIRGKSLSTIFKRKDEPETGSGSYLPRPSSGRVNFAVDINASMLYQETQNTLEVQDAATWLTDDAVLFLPTNYSPVGEPVRFVISCHGAGTTITSATSALSYPVSTLIRLGYAVLDVNGVPKSLSDNTGLHYGSPLALQSYVKAYDYVIKRYNVKKDVFVVGTSMGGLTSNMIVQSGSIPVIAQGNYCPVTDHFKQAYCNPWSAPAFQRSQIAKLFGFTGQEPTWTSTKYPSQAEIDYYMDNLDKVIGYNPMLKNTINLTSINPYNYPNTTLQDQQAEAVEYNKLIKIHPVPLKIWHNDDDGTVSSRYSEFYVNAIRHTGGLAYLRKFPSGGHNAWDNGAQITVQDVNGNNFAISASGYELDLWFKRFI